MRFKRKQRQHEQQLQERQEQRLQEPQRHMEQRLERSRLRISGDSCSRDLEHGLLQQDAAAASSHTGAVQALVGSSSSTAERLWKQVPAQRSWLGLLLSKLAVVQRWMSLPVGNYSTTAFPGASIKSTTRDAWSS